MKCHTEWQPINIGTGFLEKRGVDDDNSRPTHRSRNYSRRVCRSANVATRRFAAHHRRRNTKRCGYRRTSRAVQKRAWRNGLRSRACSIGSRTSTGQSRTRRVRHHHQPVRHCRRESTCACANSPVLNSWPNDSLWSQWCRQIRLRTRTKTCLPRAKSRRNHA